VNFLTIEGNATLGFIDPDDAYAWFILGALILFGREINLVRDGAEVGKIPVE